MQRPLLLIVDGESLKTPGLEKTLEREGWDLAWTTSHQALNIGLMGQEPSLVLMDPVRSGEAGIRTILGLRNQNPALPLVVLGEPESLPADLGITAHLDRLLPAAEWAQFFRSFLPSGDAGRKLTTEDLFGDILADIAGQPAPAVKEPPASAPPRPAAVVPVKPMLVQVPAPRPSSARPAAATIPPMVKKLPAPPPPPLLPARPVRPHSAPLQDKPVKPVHAQDRVPGPEVRSPEPSLSVALPAVPLPELPVLPDLFGDLLGPLAEPVSTPAGGPKHEFTLSGLSGIQDPFGAKGKEPSDVAAVAQDPATSASQPMIDVLGSMDSAALDLEFIGSSDNTPASRPLDQGAASLVHQPPPRTPVIPEAELPSEPFDDASLEEFGNYYLLEKIAVGGMAELFKARQRGVHNFEKIVAIKRILPHLSDNDEFVRMFIDEAKLAAQLTHPNIVQIFDLGKAGGFYYIAMEYVDGKDLRSLLRKVREFRHPFPEPVAAYVTMKVAMALDYAHRKRGMNDKELKLVHRDVSPQNVLISGEGAVKLVDFGIAKAATKSTQTMAGALKGKLLYMSPEQALGQSLDNRSDIYSLGLVLFELLTGERCFQADSELGVLEKVRLGKVQDIQSVNPLVTRDMANILNKALQKNVDQRYGSARLMERDLKSMLVRHGNEPTDHDVAEYVNTLLKGTKEQLEALLSTHFTAKTPRPTPDGPGLVPQAPAPKLEDAPTFVELKEPVVKPSIKVAHRRRPRELPRWLLPVLLCVVLALLLAFLFIAGGATG